MRRATAASRNATSVALKNMYFSPFAAPCACCCPNAALGTAAPNAPTDFRKRRRPPASSISPPRRKTSRETLLEQRDRTIPRQLRLRLVIPRRRVVVEAVLRARIDVHLVAHAGRLQRLLIGRPHLVDARVILGVVDGERALDLRHVGGGRCRPVGLPAGVAACAEA